MKFELSKKDKDSFLALNDVLDHNVDCTVLINNYMEYGYTQVPESLSRKWKSGIPGGYIPLFSHASSAVQAQSR